MVISDKHKFIFFANPRTATMSIETVLSKYQDNGFFKTNISSNPKFLELVPFIQEKHCPPFILKEIMGEDQFNGYFKFIFCRNSYDWFISQFFFNFRASSMLGFINEITPHYAKLTVENVLKIYKAYTKDRFAYQLRFACDLHSKQIVDFIGRFENLEKDWQNICDQIKIPHESLPILNKSARNGSRNYRQYFKSKESIDLVLSTLKPDFSFFNYDSVF